MEVTASSVADSTAFSSVLTVWVDGVTVKTVSGISAKDMLGDGAIVDDVNQ